MLVSLVLLVAGCAEPASESKPAVISDSPPGFASPSDEGPTPIVLEGGPPMTVPMDLPPGHPESGLHQGELIELGNEDYHAELLHEGDRVTVHVLDGTATRTVPIEAGEVYLNVVHPGGPVQFKLAAEPEADDPIGRSSRFVLTSDTLTSHLDAEGSTAKLVLTIAGVSYRGAVSHDHGGHQH